MLGGSESISSKMSEYFQTTQYRGYLQQNKFS